MDEQNFSGQGINALIPPKDTSGSSLSAEETIFEQEDNQQAAKDALEEKISEKINNTFSDFPQDLASPLNSIKKSFQEDFQQVHKIKNEDRDEVIDDKQASQKTLTGISNNISEDTSSMPLLENKIFYIEVDKIKPNPQQPRKTFSEDGIRELADSIREHGILEPLIVSRIEKETEYGADVEYQLIAGERRLLAAKMLGLPTVPVIIRKPIEEQKKLELALIENIQREDLSPISKAKAFARLIKEFGLTQQSLAERIGKSREVVANTLRLLQLSFEAQNALERGEINEGHARAILLFNNPEKRRLFLREILAKNLSGREALILAQHYLNVSSNKKGILTKRRSISLNPEDMELKEKLEEFLQMPVLIKKKGEQGAIEIKFFSQQDLNKILNKIFSL